MMELDFAKPLPEAWRLLRICWKPKRMAAVASGSLIVCLLALAYVFTVAYIRENLLAREMVNLATLARPLCVALLVYQALLWDVILPGMVSTSLSQEFVIGTWLFQQTTPQSVRKLLLGKLLGAGGDVYLASAVSLPFLVAGVLASTFSIWGVFQVCLFIIIFSAVLCTVSLYFASISGRRQNSAVTVSVLIIIVVFIFGSSLQAAYKNPGSIASLHPFYVANVALGNADRGDFIYFFGQSVPLVLFAIIFYGLLALWFFIAAESQVRKSMTIPMSRAPLFAAFSILQVLIIGFSLHGADKNHAWYLNWIMVFNSLNLFGLYYVIFNHSLNLSGLKPWLYHSRERKLTWPEFFRGDAPAVFTVAVLLVIIILGSFAFHSIIGANSNIFQKGSAADAPGFLPWLLFIELAPIIIIILRDTLFFQAGQLLWKRGREIAFVVYMIAFGAIPGIFLIKKPEDAVFDLSFVTALIAPTITDFPNFRTLLPVYLSVNLCLLVIFAVIDYRLLKKAQTSLPADLIK